MGCDISFLGYVKLPGAENEFEFMQSYVIMDPIRLIKRVEWGG